MNNDIVTSGSVNTAGDQLCLQALQTISKSINGINQTVATGFLQAGLGAVARSWKAKAADIVSVKDFGAIGDGVTDDTAALQAAINACILSQQRLFLPLGNYMITAPLQAWSWNGSAFSFFSLAIEGEKPTFNANQSNLKAPTISATFNTTAAIFVQQARAFSAKNLYIVGKNIPNIGNDPFAGMLANSNWVQGGARDTRYSPYAGICIDPFGTSVPPDGGYPGFSSYYVGTNAGSSRTTLENLYIQYFVVALALSPNGTTANNENGTVYNCQFTYNKIGMAICQSQSRNWNVIAHGSGVNHTAFDGFTYGAQQGYAPNIFGCNAAGKYLFNIQVSFSGTTAVHGLYAESLGSIGFLGGATSASSNGVHFSGCSITFRQFNNVGCDHHLIAFGPVKFTATTFTTNGVNFPYRFYHAVPNAPITFENCNIQAYSSELLLGMTGGTANTNWDDIFFLNNAVSLPTYGAQNFSHQTQRSALSTLDKGFVPLGAMMRQQSGGANNIYQVDSNEATVSLGSLAVTVSGANATFVASDATIVRVNDMIACQSSFAWEGHDLTNSLSTTWNVIGVVTANNGTTVTITGLPQSFTSGTYTLYKQWVPRFHSATTANTHTNTTVDNVSNATAWRIGDPISGSGIPAGAYISNIVGTTFTISKATTTTLTGTRIWDANVYSFSGSAV